MLWESAGSPLNIRRIIDYLIAHQFVQWQPTGWVTEMERIRSLRIPGGAASILMEKVEGLDDTERAMLESAAVFGEVSETEHLTQMFDRDAEITYMALQALVQKGLLDQSTDGKSVTFPQIHLRDAIYNTMTERRRPELHGRVARILEPLVAAGSTQHLGQIAYHYARADDPEKGIHYAMEAGDLATRTVAHEEATEFYRTALELMDLSSADEVRKSDAREKLGESYYRAGDFRSAMQSFQFLLKSIQARNHDSAPSADLDRVMKKVGKVLGKRGEQDAALSYFHNAMEQFEQLGQKLEVAELLNRIAWMYRDKDDYQAARASAQRAADLLSDDKSSIVYGYIKNMLGIIAFNVGAWDESKGHLDEALAIGRKVGSKQLTKYASTNLANTVYKLGDWQEALGYYVSNVEASEAEGDLWDLITAYNNVGVVEHGRGNFVKAAE